VQVGPKHVGQMDHSPNVYLYSKAVFGSLAVTLKVIGTPTFAVAGVAVKLVTWVGL
jgi:hypothetical protein